MTQKWEISLGVALAVTALGAATAVLWPAANARTDFVIAAGEPLAIVADHLATAGLARSGWIFKGYAILAGHEKDFQAGTYSIPPRVSTYRLVRLFAAGNFLPEGELITIPEGMNAAEIGKLLAERGYGVPLAQLLKEEGYLFPDSYYFEKSEVIQKLKANFTERTQGLAITPRLIIVASMLEKEVQEPKDMALVAGIIEQRLKLGMPLQIDATVAYGVCLPQWRQASLNIETFKHSNICDVTQVNLVDNIPRDSSYNTYQRTGLPVGPISNPGLNAIRAALNPQASDYLYYLSARDGTTIFSKTAAEHSANRRKYLGL